MKNTTKMTS